MSFNPFEMLEWLNGGGMVLTAAFLFLIAIYLFKESRRRRLRAHDWMIGRIPPSMNFAIAIAVCDAGIGLRSGVVWAWRRFYGGGEFGRVGLALLAVSALLIAIGFIYKVRAISRPDWGDGPWLLCVAALIVFLLVDLHFR